LSTFVAQTLPIKGTLTHVVTNNVEVLVPVESMLHKGTY